MTGWYLKSLGTLFQAVFQLASQALNTAIDIHRRLATAEWPEACGPAQGPDRLCTLARRLWMIVGITLPAIRSTALGG